MSQLADGDGLQNVFWRVPGSGLGEPANLRLILSGLKLAY
jgi:hypothetical protein